MMSRIKDTGKSDEVACFPALAAVFFWTNGIPLFILPTFIGILPSPTHGERPHEATWWVHPD
jgi:hypothetical protein